MRIILALTVRTFDFKPTKEIYRTIKLTVSLHYIKLMK
jgi:hypothetical protein